MSSTIEAPSKAWLDGVIASLDFETTGTNPKEDRMVSVALVFVNPDGTVRGGAGLTTLINPGIEIPDSATAVHGITTERAEFEGMDPVEALIEIRAWLLVAAQNDIPVCIYNAPFDWPLLHAEAARHAVRNIPQNLYLLDPLLMDRSLDRFRKGGRKLATVAAYYGIPLTDAHDANADAVASVGVLRGLAEKYPSIAKLTLEELQVWQADAFQARATGLNTYWKREGKSDRITGSWPGI